MRSRALPAMYLCLALWSLMAGCKSNARTSDTAGFLTTAGQVMRTPPFTTYLVRHISNDGYALTIKEALANTQRAIDRSKTQYLQWKVGGAIDKAAGEGEYFGADLLFYVNKRNRGEAFDSIMLAPIIPNSEVLRIGADYLNPGMQTSLDIRSGAKALLYPYNLTSYLPTPGDPEKPWPYSLVLRDLSIVDTANIVILNHEYYSDSGSVPVLKEPTSFVEAATIVNNHLEAFASLADTYIGDKTWTPVEVNDERLLYLLAKHFPRTLYTLVNDVVTSRDTSPWFPFQYHLARAIAAAPTDAAALDPVVTKLAIERGLLQADAAPSTLDGFVKEVMATIRRTKPEILTGLESHYVVFNALMRLNAAQAMTTWVDGPALSSEELRRAQESRAAREPERERVDATGADGRGAPDDGAAAPEVDGKAGSDAVRGAVRR